MVERRPLKADVAGSSPAAPAKPKIDWKNYTDEELDLISECLNCWKFGNSKASYHRGCLPFVSVSDGINALRVAKLDHGFNPNYSIFDSASQKLWDQWDLYFCKKMGLNDNDCREALEFLRETRR